MAVINSVTTAITLTVLFECIRILCQFSKPNWFWKSVKPPLETSLLVLMLQNNIFK